MDLMLICITFYISRKISKELFDIATTVPFECALSWRTHLLKFLAKMDGMTGMIPFFVRVRPGTVFYIIWTSYNRNSPH